MRPLRLLAPLAVAAVAASGSTAAAATPQGPASGVCPVKHVAGVKGAKVTVGVNIGQAGSTAAARAGCGRVAHVVRRLAAARAEMPMRAAGYRCTPTVTGSRVKWRCTYRGGRPRTTVTLSFAWRYA